MSVRPSRRAARRDRPGRRRPRAGTAGVLAAALALLWPAAASAEPPSDPDELDEQTLARYRRLSRAPGGYGRVFGALTFGRGLRFNNPYRLRTQLGETAESLSLTAPYVDVAIGMGFGSPEGLHHGGVLHLCFALEGVAQQNMSASYLLGYRGHRPVLVYGRLGPSLIVTPDTTVGAELAAGAAYYFTGLWGITAEIVGDLFYGAGSYAAEFTAYPILSGQAGIIGDFEVLP